MSFEPNHIRLLIGIEAEPGPLPARTLERSACEGLADALATDLARLAPQAETSLLVVAGTLLEPADALRPGFPVWQALESLVRSVPADPGGGGRVLAIGAHNGRLPESRLQPPDTPPSGQLLIVPMLLVADEEVADELRADLESGLFERGGVHPPARAVLAEAAGIESTHGQLLTLADLIALQQVQLDSAGMGAFWPVAEQALLEPEAACRFDLPAGLTVDWQDRRAVIDFHSFDQYGEAPDAYALWVRAFRSLCALLELHGIPWHARSDLTVDERLNCLVESLGPVTAETSLTIQQHDDCGLLAWTLVEDGRQINLYPLDGRAFSDLRDELRQRGLPLSNNPGGVCYDPELCKLSPAPLP